MKVYIAGPMTGHEDMNRAAFYKAADALEAAGYEVVNPAALDDASGPLATWEAYLKRDIPYLLTCDGVALLPGWWTSKGARLEHHNAVSLGMKVQVLGDWLREVAK